ncbi:MAG: aminodeoxychorismate synthase component I [Anaerolineales bacterium]
MSNEIILHEPRTGLWLHFREPRVVIEARTLAEVLPALRRVEAATQGGAWAAGFIAYEAAPAFDPTLTTHASADFPLVWFGIYDAPQHLTGFENLSGVCELGEWTSTVTEAEYARAVECVKDHIARGLTYQVNYTYRLRAPFRGEPRALFAQLTEAGRAPYAAFVAAGRFAICSASPELFFTLEDGALISKPMKGTAARGRTLAEDEAQADWLRNSEKNRAENVMIVDMIRNDIGRVAEVGSVRVPSLFDVERYPTLWQMTSTVTGTTHRSLTDTLAALFPCASITGAPKRSTMRLIRELESTPRRLYTGAIGFITPEGRAQFNVAIRTVVVDRERGEAEYGVGSGIVWDSDAADEWAECAIKARVLREKRPEFELLESLRWEPAPSPIGVFPRGEASLRLQRGLSGYWLSERHLQRLRDSAIYFQFELNVEEVRARLEEFALTLPALPHKVRLTAQRGGGLHCEAAPLPEHAPSPVTLALARTPVHSTDVFLFHKTTQRAVYEAARAAHPHAGDVLLWNERGEITETTTANLAVQLEGQWFTPPLECGLLAGTYRAELLDQGKLTEHTIMLEMLRRAEGSAVINSVRGWRAAILVDSPQRHGAKEKV